MPSDERLPFLGSGSHLTAADGAHLAFSSASSWVIWPRLRSKSSGKRILSGAIVSALLLLIVMSLRSSRSCIVPAADERGRASPRLVIGQLSSLSPIVIGQHWSTLPQPRQTRRHCRGSRSVSQSWAPSLVRLVGTGAAVGQSVLGLDRLWLGRPALLSAISDARPS